METTPIAGALIAKAANPKRWSPSSLELLESRIAPAAVTVGNSFEYVDGDGDHVKVVVSGKAGSVEFLSNGVEVQGADIDHIVISHPSSDFSLTFSDTNHGDNAVPGSGDDVIKLGRITGPADARISMIRGVFTIDSSTGVKYELAGYKGSQFSTGGGLNILGELTGSDGGGAGLNLRSIPAGTAVNFRDGFAVGASGIISGALLGTFSADGLHKLSSLSIGSIGGKLSLGEIAGNVTVLNGITGRMIVGETNGAEAHGLIDIKGTIAATGRVSDAADLNLKVGKDILGNVTAAGDLTLNVGRSLNGAVVLGGGSLSMEVVGSILNHSTVTSAKLATKLLVSNQVADSSIVGGGGLSMTVGTTVTGSRISGGTDDLDLNVTQNVELSQIKAGGIMTATISGGVVTSTIHSDGDMTINILGDVSDSQIGSKSSTLDATVSGNVVSSHFLSGDDGKLYAKKDLTTSDFTAGQSITLKVDGQLAASQFGAGTNLTVTVGGNVVGSSFLPSNNLEVTVGGNVLQSRMETLNGFANLQVTGTLSALGIDSGREVTISKSASVASDVTIDAASSVSVTSDGNVSARMSAAGDVFIKTKTALAGSVRAAGNLEVQAASVKIPTDFAALLPALENGGFGVIASKRGIWIGGDLKLLVTGSVLAPVIDVGHDVTKFSVTGGFNSRLRVAGDFNAGKAGDIDVMVVGGTVSATALFDIGGNFGGSESADKLIFGGNFSGRLNVGGKLLVDLRFNKNANRLTFAGGVGSTQSASDLLQIAQIVVDGKLSYFNSGSYFVRTDSTGGNFVDGSGTVSGNLDAVGGALRVFPLFPQIVI